MRRALVDELPAWSHYFHLTPLDVERMTLRELHAYREHMTRARLAAEDGDELL